MLRGGGFKGNIYEAGGEKGEENGVNLLYEVADLGTDLIPIVGTVKDAYKFYQEPSWENAGWLTLSVASDLLPFLKPVKSLKAAKVATKAAKTAQEASTALIKSKANRAFQKMVRLQNTPNINPKKVRRALNEYSTYSNEALRSAHQSQALDRAAKNAAVNYLMKYQIPKVGGEVITNTVQHISEGSQKALGGSLFNSRTPIESFQGGKPLPIVRK